MPKSQPNERPGLSAWAKADVIGKIAIPVIIFLFGMSQTINNQKKITLDKERQRQEDSIKSLLASKQNRLNTELQVLNIVWADLNSENFVRTTQFINNFLGDQNIQDSSSILRRALAARSNIVMTSEESGREQVAVAANVVNNYKPIDRRTLKNYPANAAAGGSGSSDRQLSKVTRLSGLPVVYIQYSNALCAERANWLKKYLGLRFITPDVERVKVLIGETQVRYFHAEDKLLAEEIIAYCSHKVEPLHMGAVLINSAKTIPKKQVEIWLGSYFCAE